MLTEQQKDQAAIERVAEWLARLKSAADMMIYDDVERVLALAKQATTAPAECGNWKPQHGQDPPEWVLPTAKQATTPPGDLGKAVEVAESRLVQAFTVDQGWTEDEIVALRTLIAHAKKPVRYALGGDQRAALLGLHKALTELFRESKYIDALTAALNIVGFTGEEARALKHLVQERLPLCDDSAGLGKGLLAKLDAMVAEGE